MLLDPLRQGSIALLILLFGIASTAVAQTVWSINDLASGNVDTVLKSIEQIPQEQINQPVTRAGQTPFLMVTTYGSTKIRFPALKALIERGASPTLRDDDENTALMLLNTPDADIVRFLVEQGVDINAVNKDGDTALHVAARERLIDYVELLLTNGADLNLKNARGETPLLLAAQVGDEALFKLFAERGADTEMTDNQGNGVLHAVVDANDEPFLNLLLKDEIDIDRPNHAGDTPLSLAANQERWTIARELLRKGANPNVPMQGDTSVGLYILAHPELKLGKLVPQKKVDIDFVTSSGRTALEKAVSAGDPAQVRVALKMGAGLDTLPPGAIVRLCEQMAGDQARGEALMLLRKAARSKAGRSDLDEQCLTGAIRAADPKLVGELIERGAGLQGKRAADQPWQSTPIGLALNKKLFPITRQLLQANAAAGKDPHIPWPAVEAMVETLKAQPDNHPAEQVTLLLLDQNIYTTPQVLQSQSTLAALQWMVHAPSALLRDSAQRMRFVDRQTEEPLAPPLQSQLAKRAVDDALASDATAAGDPDTVKPLEFPDNAKLYLIGIYRGAVPGEDGPLSANKDCAADGATCAAQLAGDTADVVGQVIVDVGPGKDPLILALTAHQSTRWVVKNPTKRPIAGVIVSGQQPQRVDGLVHDTLLHVTTAEPSACRNCSGGETLFVLSDREDEGYGAAIEYLAELTGRKPSRQHLRYRARQVSVR
ncbi:ankyrin repeat domain-containing protein [Thiosocius teredinicola]|uniref:ankyrin repeat domain-containing protein n=1 Tax=Thiosocius teredinicola TaxID=1973002 RepID=UPI0009910681